MNVSREFAIQVLTHARKTMDDWISELETPTIEQSGGTHPCYPKGVPSGVSVGSLNGIPADQLRAELLATAGALAALAET